MTLQMVLNIINALAITATFLCLLLMLLKNTCYFVLIPLFVVSLVNGFSYIYNIADLHYLTLASSFFIIALNKGSWFNL